MRILSIEDDPATAQSIELMLKSEGFHVYTTDLGEEGYELAKLYDYDLLLLDLNLPDISGFEVLMRLRREEVKIPILILSGLAGVEDQVRGLGLGADGYLTKPFHKDLLVAHIHALIRRSRGYARSTIVVGGLAMDLAQKKVTVDGKTLALTNKEYEMLNVLMLRAGSVVSKEAVLGAIYAFNPPDVKIVDVVICKIRKKIADASDNAGYIETVWGRGYVVRVPETVPV